MATSLTRGCAVDLQVAASAAVGRSSSEVSDAPVTSAARNTTSAVPTSRPPASLVRHCQDL